MNTTHPAYRPEARGPSSQIRDLAILIRLVFERIANPSGALVGNRHADVRRGC